MFRSKQGFNTVTSIAYAMAIYINLERLQDRITTNFSRVFVLVLNPSKASKLILCQRQLHVCLKSTVEILFQYIMKCE